MKIVVLSALLALAGCASTDTGVVPMGNGVYMQAKRGGPLTHLGAEVKVELLKEAAGFCGRQGKSMVIGDTTSRDATSISHATAEIQFRCA